MDTVICGDGPMGRAVAEELAAAGCAVRVLGRPRSGAHDAADLAAADVMHEFSIPTAVASNVEAALAAGVRRFVIGTTGWADDRERVEAAIVSHGAAAVVAPTFSPGATILINTAARLGVELRQLDGYDPFVIEWHRAGKRDRPSGTALAIASRMVAAGGEEPEVSSIRAGSSPGMHLVGWDAPGETFELRLTARDRRCYASGARLAAEWLVADARAPGFHTFESVIDDRISERSPA